MNEHEVSSERILCLFSVSMRNRNEMFGPLRISKDKEISLGC